MTTDIREWSSWDSRQCWNALVAMWASESFMNCLKRKDEPSEGGAEAEVETIVLSWDEKHGKFNGGFSNEATKS